VSDTALPYDSDEPVEIADGVYWVGYADADPGLHCNPYLLVDGDEAVLLDPGPVVHFPVVARKIVSLVDPGSISTIILHHHDPDLCGAVPVLEDVIDRADLRIVSHSRSLVFIRYYGVRSSLVSIDQQGLALALASGRRLEFVFTPYLHAPGAIATWDGTTRTLFTSDLCGGFARQWDLFASGDYAERAVGFHRAYMPDSELLQRTLAFFRALDPATLAPQHGAVCRGETVGAVLARLAEVECGIARGEPWYPESLRAIAESARGDSSE